MSTICRKDGWKNIYGLFGTVYCTVYSVHTFYKVLADFDNIGTGHMKNALHAHGSVHRLEPRSTLPNRKNIFNPFLFIKNKDFLYPHRVSPPLGKKRRDMFLRTMLPIQSGVTDSR